MLSISLITTLAAWEGVLPRLVYRNSSGFRAGYRACLRKPPQACPLTESSTSSVLSLNHFGSWRHAPSPTACSYPSL